MHDIRALLTIIATALVTVAGRETLASPPVTINQGLAFGSAEIGLSPEAVVVSGLTASATVILENLISAQTLCDTLAQQRSVLGAATAAKSQLEVALSAQPDSSELQQQYQAALVALDTATAAVADLCQSLLAQVMTGISEPGQQHYQTFQLGDGRRVPAAFRVKARTNDVWREIELALIAEARAQFQGQPFEEQQALLLASIRGEAEVVAAQAALDISLASMQAAFAAALAPTNP